MAKRRLELTPANAWRAYWDDGKSFPECAALFDVSVGTLYRKFQLWSFPTRPRGPKRGTAGASAIVTDEGIKRILETAGELSLAVLSNELGVSRERINQIRHGKHRPV